MTSGRREGHGVRLAGMRTVLLPDDPRFPAALRVIPRPPKRLYVLGDPEVLTVATPPLTRRRFPKARPRWRFWVAAAMCRTLENMRACSSG